MDKDTGLTEVTATANDVTSMIKEASGVRVEYSTDSGVTFSTRVLAYLDGNFVGPTRFRGDLGPFTPGTKLAMSIHAEDIAGNTTVRKIDPVVIPGPSHVKGQDTRVGE